MTFKPTAFLTGTLRNKLLLLTLAISMLVTFTLYLFLSLTLKNMTMQKQLHDDANSFGQVDYYFQHYFKNVEASLEKLTSNAVIQRELSRDITALTMLETKEAADRLNNELYDLLPSTAIVNSIMIVGANGLNGVYSSNLFAPFTEWPTYQQLRESEWFQRASQAGKEATLSCPADNLCLTLKRDFPLLFNEVQGTIYYAMTIADNRSRRELGLFIATFKQDIWNQTLANYPFSGTTFLFSERNELLWSNAHSSANLTAALKEVGRLPFGSQIGYRTLNVDGRQQLVDYTQVLNGKFKLINVADVGGIGSLIHISKTMLAGLYGAYLAVALALSYYFAGIVSNQLMKLAKSLKHGVTEQGQVRLRHPMRFHPLFKKWPLRMKLVLYFCATLLLPSLLIIAFAIYQASDLLKTNMKRFTSEIVQTANANADLFLRDYELLLNNIAYSPEAQAILGGQESAQEKIQNMIQENRMLRKEMLAVNIYDASGKHVFSSPYPGKSYNDPIGGSLMERSRLEKSGKMYFYSSGIDPYLNAVQVFAKNVFNAEKANAIDVFGYVTVDIDQSMIGTLYGNIRLGDTGFFRILDTSGNDVLLNSDSRFRLDEKLKQTILSQDAGDFVQVQDGVRYMVVFHTSPSTHWKTIGIVPEREITKQANDMRVEGGLLLAVIALALFAIAYAYSRHITKPLATLQELMAKMESGETGVRMKARGNDEIYMLASSFNRMADRLNTLIHEVYASKIREQELQFLEKEAQLNALKQQINPHFLYNTLDSINWLAYQKGAYEVCEMSSALGAFFRGNISDGREFVAVRQEVEHVKTYLVIQQIRYPQKFEVNWEIDEAIANLPIMKLTLQPLIENSIQHAFEHLEAGGRISIVGKLQENMIEFRVADNGNGMTPERLADIERALEGGEKRAGIGLNNVRERMRLYFGNRCFFQMKSSVEEGTTVTIRYPSTTHHREAMSGQAKAIDG